MFTFNDRQSDDPALGIYRVLRVFFPLVPGTTDRTIDIPGLDGAHDFGRDLQPREIRVQFVLKQDSPEDLFDYVREVAAWLSVREAKPFIYSYEPDKFYLARPQGIVGLDRLMNKIGIVEATFIAHDPYAYALDTKTATAFPATNSGAVSCPAIITATLAGPVNHFKVTLDGTDDYILLDKPLATGDVITMDTDKHLTTVNGVDARPDVTALSTYFRLPAGEFILVTEPAGIALEVKYREMWI